MEHSSEKSDYIEQAEAPGALENELTQPREELNAEREARQRLAAEYENYRRRTNKEMTQAREEGKRELLEGCLSVSDDLDLAIAGAGESSDAVAEGLRMIHRRFQALLESNGVVSFKSQGTKFDPQQHEAYDVISGAEDEVGIVREELRRGYFWNGKLLRPALVVVSQ